MKPLNLNCSTKCSGLSASSNGHFTLFEQQTSEPQYLCGHFGEDKNLLLCPGIERRNFGCLVRSLAHVVSQVSQLLLDAPKQHFLLLRMRGSKATINKSLKTF